MGTSEADIVAGWRSQFPILARPYNGKRLAYLDNGASTQKPRAVIDAMTACLEGYYANVHRGAYELSLRCTEETEALRERAARRFNLPDERNKSGTRANVVFVRGTTEAINLVAQSWGRSHLRAGDVVMLSQLEHHANIIPWHLLREQIGIEIAWIPVRRDDGRLDMDAAERMIEEYGADRRLKLVSLAHVSNVLGTILPVQRLTAMAHAVGARMLVDGAQAAGHLAVDVARIGCDFYAMSGHKMYGPTGIGLLYAKAELLEAMPAWQGGGDMILEVRQDGWRPNDIPYKFEAGTPAIVEEIGLVAAFDWLEGLAAPDVLHRHEVALTRLLMRRLADVPGITFYGPPADAEDRVGSVSFTLGEVHPHDIASVLDMHGVCVRAGHHCAQPLMTALGIGSTTRASLGIYNDADDIEQLCAGLEAARGIFA